MLDVAVSDKQVVVVRHENWVQAKEFFIKEGNTVAIGVGEGGLEEEDLGVKCNYFGEVSIDDDALGVVLDRNGDIKQIKQIITFKIGLEVFKNTTVDTRCNLTNRETPVMVDSRGVLEVNMMKISSSGRSASSCCLTASTILKSYGQDCPTSSEEIFENAQSCQFSKSIPGKCNYDSHQTKVSQFCRASNISCVIQQYFHSSCVAPDDILRVCDAKNMKC